MGLNWSTAFGQTPLNEEEIEGLKLPSVATRGELDELEQLNIEQAIEWTLRLKLGVEDIFNERFVLELHRRMFGQVWTWAGRFRRSEKNIGCKSYYIPIELKQLLDDAKFWYANKTYLPEELAIRFKHRLVNIHCYSLVMINYHIFVFLAQIVHIKL